MDEKVSVSIGLEDANGDLIIRPDRAILELVGKELSQAGLALLHVGRHSITVSGTRTLIKDVLGVDLPTPPYGCYTAAQTLPGLNNFVLSMEIYPPVRHLNG